MSLAKVQLDADLSRLGKTPPLLRRKWTRMAASPFAFLRGASALWAEAMRQEPALLRGVPGRGTLVGDLHLENVGTFRTARGVALHVNDFDESFEGPWSFDVVRLLTSTLLARPELGCTGLEVLRLAELVLEGHAVGVAGGSARLPATLAQVVATAATKPDDKFLAKRLVGPDQLIRDEKTPPAPASRIPLARRAIHEWAQATKQTRPVTLVDLTRRVAGTGSLGVERLIALVRIGDEERLLELKEVRGSSFADVHADAARLLESWAKCLPRPPLEVAAALLGAVPVIVRPLFACDDKLAVEDFDRTALPQTLKAIGVMAGEVHRRGATSLATWTDAHRDLVLTRAIHLAGLHEQAFGEFCRGVRDALR
jgi:hypothetical protein